MKVARQIQRFLKVENLSIPNQLKFMRLSLQNNLLFAQQKRYLNQRVNQNENFTKQEDQQQNLSEQQEDPEIVNEDEDDQDDYEKILQQESLDVDSINEKIRLFFRSKQRNYEDFDLILHQIQMNAMQSQDISGPGSSELFDEFNEIAKIFKERCERKDFATIKYVIYLQFGGIVLNNQAIVDDLVRYGFDFLYPKLQWIDKVISMESAQAISAPYMSNMIDKICCEILFQDYNDFIGDISLPNLIQLMTIFHTQKYQRQELWNKFEVCLAYLYELSMEEMEKSDQKEPTFTKDDIFVVLKLLVDRKIVNSEITEGIFKDVEFGLQNNEFNLKEILLLQDSYYKLGAFQDEHQQAIADYILEQKYVLADFQELKLNENLRLFRGLFSQNKLTSLKYKQIHQIYEEIVKNNQANLNLSTWLTVIETCRFSETHLDQLLEYAKKQYLKNYSDEYFETSRDGVSTLDTQTSHRRSELFKKKPKSVLVNKREFDV
ncbi:UNKNOWN [Stylonychia lemnae]|uniref:Uncharacterized protein n=1 Tax=Stylonychia lemnae TaxID=5949 RepID=A0A077ZW53_STYLE|nr:UNKNOWN [Stylonychia lemnae]|eukprot:CDW74094.1 UNKNOWN [Stylonychia lemnae]